MQITNRMLRRAGIRAVHGTAATSRVVQPMPFTTAPNRVISLRAASVESQVTNAQPEDEVVANDYGSPAPSALDSLARDPEIVENELDELDAAQEQLLHWMLTRTEQQQEEDLDEMIDYDEFGNDESAEMHAVVDYLITTNSMNIRVGDKVRGTVYDVDEEGAYIDIAGKSSGFVPLAECSFAKLKTPLEVLRVGMTREFVVVGKEDGNGQVLLSLAVIEASIMWQRMKQLLQEEVTVKVKVDSANRGGLLVKYGPFDGFIPVGQCGQSITADNMATLVGQEIPVQFLEVNEEGERLVFSSRKASGVTLQNNSSFKIGDVVVGVVQQVKPYGAFVDIGGLTGLLHLSQITAGRLVSVEKIFKEGDQIKVMILSMDLERSRITLSTKKLEPEPGDMLKNPLQVYERADEMAAIFRERMDQAQQQLHIGLGMGQDYQSPQPMTSAI